MALVGKLLGDKHLGAGNQQRVNQYERCFEKMACKEFSWFGYWINCS